MTAADEQTSGRQLSAAEIARALGRHEPTAEQAAIIEAPLEPFLVVAGAGSGKTETMASRVVWLVANGLVRAEDVLGLTFTRKAAGELSDRIRMRLRALRRQGIIAADDGLGLDQPTVSTYHGYAAGLVADHGLRLAVEPDAAMLGDAGRWQLADEIVRRAGADELGDFDTPASTVIAAVLALADGLNEHLQPPQSVTRVIDAVSDHAESLPRKSDGAAPGNMYADVKKDIEKLRGKRALVPLVERFNQAKTDRGFLDFGDQVRFACDLVRRFPGIVDGERARWKVVMLDEYQDTSYSQLKLLTTLFANGHAVTAVGDPLQSIYAWRGASAGNLDDFPQDFAHDGRPAHVRFLTTSWRNDANILAVANLLARPLSGRHSAVLEPAPTAGDGDVVTSVTLARDEEITALVDWIRDQRGPGDGSGKSIAVLCRRRSSFQAIEAALTEADIPVEVVGLGGLLATPEVSDIVQTLRVVDDPGRGDALMRLLTSNRWRLGVTDVAALSDYAKRMHRETTTNADAMNADNVDRYSLADGLESLTESDRRFGFTPAGLRRMMRLAATLRRLRRRSSAALPDLVRDCERELLLDVEVAARPGYSPAAARSHLDAFADAAAKFAAAGSNPTLSAFLSWIDAAESEERGLAVTASEPDPAAVQLMTVHAAKGLEWDAVALPDLADGVFPAAPCSKSGWLDLGSVPYELRGDKNNLPHFAWQDAESQVELRDNRENFREAVADTYLSEERRLAYVAFTRARTSLRLSTAYWGDAKQPREVSRFVDELAEAGLLDRHGWAEPPTADASKPEADDGRERVWPGTRAEDPHAAARETAAMLVQQIAAGDRPRAAGTGRTRRDMDLLLAERDAGRPGGIAMPERMSPTLFVDIDKDPHAAAARLSRPMPRGPSAAARLGTRFHEWLESRFGQAALLDPDDIAGTAGKDATNADEQALQRLKDTFLGSRFAERVPIAVEKEFEMRLGPQTVPGKIDAVFTSGTGYEIVDWKTGRQPAAEQLEHTRLQLAVYRIAFAEGAGITPDDVRATFYFLGSDSEVTYPGPTGMLPDEAELIERLASYMSG